MSLVFSLTLILKCSDLVLSSLIGGLQFFIIIIDYFVMFTGYIVLFDVQYLAHILSNSNYLQGSRKRIFHRRSTL